MKNYFIEILEKRRATTCLLLMIYAHSILGLGFIDNNFTYLMLSVWSLYFLAKILNKSFRRFSQTKHITLYFVASLLFFNYLNVTAFPQFLENSRFYWLVMTVFYGLLILLICSVFYIHKDHVGIKFVMAYKMQHKTCPPGFGFKSFSTFVMEVHTGVRHRTETHLFENKSGRIEFTYNFYWQVYDDDAYYLYINNTSSHVSDFLIPELNKSIEKIMANKWIEDLDTNEKITDLSELILKDFVNRIDKQSYKYLRFGIVSYRFLKL